LLQTFPALFGLYKQNLLPKGVHIIGYARTKMDDAEFKKRQTSYIKGVDDPEVKAKLDEFISISTYISGQYDQDDGFQELEKHLVQIESTYADKKEKNRLFYFALPPSVFIPVAQHVKKNNYTANITRLIIEKPFGKDLESCRELISALKAEWTEDETFRIDHYLGKEMVKNILLFRFANVAINSGWDRNTIANVQISFKEPFGTEGRGGYFDEFGMIRDVLQNRTWFLLTLFGFHELSRTRPEIRSPSLTNIFPCCGIRWNDVIDLLQVLTIFAMERPVSFGAEDIRDEKVCVPTSLHLV
jgi:glucose-6-phosphate 1-dehydrogenase